MIFIYYVVEVIQSHILLYQFINFLSKIYIHVVFFKYIVSVNTHHFKVQEQTVRFTIADLTCLPCIIQRNFTRTMLPKSMGNQIVAKLKLYMHGLR